MKKLYTLLLAAAGLCTAATAQTTADLAGRYAMTCETQLNPAIEGYEPSTSFNVTITASETAEDTVYMDGFLGTAMDMTTGETLTVPGKYDATAKTITFTQPDGAYLINMTDYSACILSAPLVLTVGTDADGNIQLKQQDEAVYFAFGLQTYDSTYVSTGIMENIVLTKQQNYTISKEDLLGTYTFTYLPVNAESGELEDAATSKFAIGEEEDGSLYIVGLFGNNRHIPFTYGENSFTIDAIMEEGETGAFMLIDYASMGQSPITVDYGENGQLDFNNMFAYVNNEEMIYVYMGAATKDEVNAITTATTTTDAPVKAYTIDGRAAGTGVASKLQQNLPAGLYILGGKKVLVK